jgi:hypothetical protein
MNREDDGYIPDNPPEPDMFSSDRGGSSVVDVQMSVDVTVDECLTRYVGEFGKGQFWMVFLASLSWFPLCFFMYGLVFTTKDPRSDPTSWYCTDASDENCAQVLQLSP